MRPVFQKSSSFLVLVGFGLLALMTQCASVVADEPPKVAVVIGEEAPELDRYAAVELCGYLEKLYGIRTTPSEKASEEAEVVILVGNPETNPAVAKAFGTEAWPKLTDQGIVLKIASLKGKPVLVVGGGSPKATLWAVYELVERWGVRYLLHGDVLPDDAGEFRLPTEEVTLEPKLRIRQWRVLNDFACGPESWGMADYRPVLDQLAKFRFNRIYVSTYPWQPFLHLEVDGVARKSASLWYEYKYPITDDMPGRELFGNRPEFWNPDLPFDAPYEEFAAAGEKLVHNLMAHAHARGMECAMPVHLLHFPPEFKGLPGDWESTRQMTQEVIVPGSKTSPEDLDLIALAATVLQATVNTYPEVDYLVLSMPERRHWTERYEEAWHALDAKYGISEITSLEEVVAAAGKRPDVPGDIARAATEAKGDLVTLCFYDRLLTEHRALADSRRPDMKFIYRAVAEELFPILSQILPPGSETLNFLAYTPARVVQRREAIARLNTEKIPATLIFTLHDDNVGLLPALTTGSLHELTKDLRQHGWAGYMTRYWLISDHDPCVAYMARAAWDSEATPESVYRDQIRATCGEAAILDMLTMFRELEETSILLEWKALGLAFPVPGMMTKHWQQGLMPEVNVEAREGYQRALAATQQAREKTPEEKRAYVDYWIGRLEYGVGYFDTIESARATATAEKSGKPDEALRHAEEALAKARIALEAYAGVARDQSDRGGIAILAEYVYRPLKDKVAELKSERQP